MSKKKVAELMKKFGKLLMLARESAGLTQGEVAKRLGYSSPQFISNIERGMCPVPLKVIAQLISMYRMNPEVVIKAIMEQSKVELHNELR